MPTHINGHSGVLVWVISDTALQLVPGWRFGLGFGGVDVALAR